MNKLQMQIHELLKSKYEKASGKNMICQKSFSPVRSKFYFENLDDNFYEPMADDIKAAYDNGAGNERTDKMHALRSSSAMTYNLLGNGPVIVKENSIIGSGTYRLQYEKQLETLKNSKAPATLDAFLEKDDELCFCEMKLFEPLYHKTNFLKELSSNYDDMDRYFFTDSAYSFTESLDKLKISDIKRYDACQMYKHALGIYNYVRQNELKGKKVTLLNCVWTMDADLKDEKSALQYKQIEDEEYSGFVKFKDCMFNVINAFSKLGIDFSIKFVTVKEFVELLDIPEEKKNWLNRY